MRDRQTDNTEYLTDWKKLGNWEQIDTYTETKELIDSLICLI